MKDDASDPLLLPPPAAPSDPSPSQHLEFKALLLLLFMLSLVIGAALYVMYARGVFESNQRLVLMADDSEGVVVGMDLTFSGFPIGRVRRIELAEDGKARILVDVATKDAHWLRQSSVFTLVRGLVGSTNIRAYSGLLTDPPLEDGAVRTVLLGDAAGEVPKLVAAAKELIENLNSLASQRGAIGASFERLQTMIARVNGPGGAMSVLLGSDAEAKKIIQTLERTNTLLMRLDGLALKADAQVFGEQPGKLGVLPETRATVIQLNALLQDARGSLKKVDAVLLEAQAVGANVKDASGELGNLRTEVEASLRKVDGLVNEINRKWPFARDAEVKLP